MEKIKITVEQEKALKNLGGGFMSIEQKWINFLTGSVFMGELDPLNDFTADQFALILLGWYEVAQPFKVGDWVYDNKAKIYAKVISVADSNEEMQTTYSFYSKFYREERLEKVTEPWKIMLLDLGREKPEFNKNDVIVTESEVYEAEYLSDEEIIVLFEKDLVRAFHAAENRIEVKGHDS